MLSNTTAHEQGALLYVQVTRDSRPSLKSHAMSSPYSTTGGDSAALTVVITIMHWSNGSSTS
jgi:hypothetical protein